MDKVSAGMLPYSRKLSREKTFANFTVLWLYTKVFTAKFGAWHRLAQQKRPIHESFLHEKRIFHQFTKVFSLESFPLYGNLESLVVCMKVVKNRARVPISYVQWMIHKKSTRHARVNGSMGDSH